MGLYKTFKSDAVLETGGRWFDIKPANDDGTVPGFLLARRSSRNIPFQKRMEQIQREHRVELDNGTMDGADARDIIIEAFVDTVLKDWRNVQDEHDKPLALSKPNAMKLLTDLPDLFDILNAQAGLLANYQDKLIQAAGKNSPQRS